MNRMSRAMLRAAAGAVYRGDAASRLPILMYHRVLPAPDALLSEVPHAGLMNEQMKTFAEVFTVLPLDEAIERLAAGRLPARAMAITFDDGYGDNHDVALPILRRHGLCATFFVSSGFLDGGRMFNDSVTECVRRLPTMDLEMPQWGIRNCRIGDIASRVAAIEQIVSAVKYLQADARGRFCSELEALVEEPLPTNLMMTSQQVRNLVAQGMQVGGHTVTHPILEAIDDASALAEITRNRADLQQLTGVAPTCFAYPNGKPHRDFEARHIEMVRAAGYSAALSTAYSASSRGYDRYQLPRYVPIERSPVALVARAIRMSFHPDPEFV